MTPPPSALSYLPETPSQTAGPYVHIGLIPHQAGFEIFENNFSGDIAGPGVAGQRIVIEGRIFDGAGHVARDVLVEAWQALGDPYAAALELAEGDADARLAALTRLDELGARPAAARVRRDLRRSGVTVIPRGPKPTTRENPAGLTDRQVEILRMLADGATNAEIAARLVLSVRTVDHHVSAVLQKLGVPGRREAIAAAVDFGLAR